ncbi:MAG: hypothetical protein GY928_00835 [Colwellia sp.]|nr:hypothetical protein [Colwellia sp.]
MADNKYLGTLCKRGHDYEGTGKSLRYNSKACCLCQKEKSHKFYKDNKERLDKVNKQWALDHPERTKQVHKKYRDANKDKRRYYRQINKKRYRETQKIWKEKNRERVTRNQQAWYVKNREEIKKRSSDYAKKKRRNRRCGCGALLLLGRSFCEKCLIKRTKGKRQAYRERAKPKTRIYTKKNIVSISDQYVRGLLGSKISNTPKELIDIKRMQLKLYRLIKERSKG